ncbi:hypothetical protein RhiirB3_446730 [Rhizophagus irregularis]|nr:hypothetical protein RhiirB3_446730 [Rhizophagus irregularis]
MQSEIDLLRKCITKLKAELEAKNSEIPELRKKLAEFEVKDVVIHELRKKRESAAQDSSSNTAYISGTINNIEKMDVPKITNCTSSELSHKTKVIEDIVNSAVNSDTINDQNASEEIGKTVSLEYNQNASENSEEIRKTVSLRYNWVASKSLKKIESKADYQDKSVVELIFRLISIKRLANSFCQANGARNRSITAKQAEITAWHLFLKNSKIRSSDSVKGSISGNNIVK